MGLKNEDNFQKKCRLCGRLGRRFTDIFTPHQPSAVTKPNRKLSQLIYKCLQLQVKEDDSLPKKICDDCNKKLSSWQNFYKKCEQTQKRLQQYLENWQKSSVCVCSSNQNSVICSDVEGSHSCKDLSQISHGDKTSAETNLTKTSVLPKKVKTVSSVNSGTKTGVSVITKNYKNVEYKNREDTSKVKNVSDNSNNSEEKVKTPATGSHKKNVCPEETDNTIEQAQSIVESKENEQLQTNFTAEATVCVKRIKFSESSLKTKKSIEAHQCHICEKTFPSRGKLNAHVAAHLSLSEFQCEKCSKKFRSKFSLRNHLETHSAIRNYCCHLCGRLFHTASGLCNHVKLHSEETKRFACPLCSKQFRQAGHLEQHQRTHTGERPHQCTECEQRFTTRCQLSRHVQGVHRCAKKHKCLVCGKEFLYSTNFKAHLLRHAGQRNNKCGECGKTFVTSNALFRHRRSHTGDKPFQCGICGKKFADCSNRKRHMVRHLQQPVIPRGRKSGPRPKLARIINLKDATSTHQEQPPPSKEVQLSEGQSSTKECSKLVQVSTPPLVGSSQAEGNINMNSSQNIQISGEVIQLCSSNNVELTNLTSVSTSELPQQFNIHSTKNQLLSYNNMITDTSNIYVSLSQDLPQLIQLSTQDTNFVIQPGAHDVTQLVQNCGTERQYVGQLDSSLMAKLSHSVHILKPTTKANDSTLYTKNVHHENSVQQNGGVVFDKADKAKLYHSQEDNADFEVDNPKTYVNLRTFLESSEVVETLSSSRNDDIGDGDNGLVNVEYVTLMADDGNEARFSSGVQEIIVLPHDTIISDYDLSKNAGKFRMVVQGNEGSSDRKPACYTEQIIKEHNESVTVLTEALVPSQNINDDSHLSLTAGKGKVTQHNLQTSNTGCNNLIEVLLPKTDGNKLSTNTEGVNDKIQNETLDSSNLVQVLLETDGSNTRTQQEYANRTQQTLLASSDGFGDEDAIIRMLSSQGTVMLSTTPTDFDLTKSPVAEVTQLTEGGSEAVGVAIDEDQTQPLLNFKSFSTVDATVMHETTGMKEANNGCIDVTSSSDYSHEISLTTAFTLNNSDLSSIVQKALSQEEELKDGMPSGGLQTSDQNEIPTGTMDDIEIFELCTEEDLTKFAPIYQVYHTGKSIENV